MRIGEVIGTVTLSRVHPALVGARWVVAVPCSLDALRTHGRGDGEDLVVYDDLGGAVGQTIGFVEGREAASPFDGPAPVDAICAALVDEIFYNPFTK